MKLRLDITGTSPLLMHNEQLANPLNHWAREMKKVNDKRKKSDDDRFLMLHLEWLGGIYHTDEDGPYVPDRAIRAVIAKGAGLTRQAAPILRAMSIPTQRFPLSYEGPRDLEGLYEAGFLDVRLVGVQRNRVTRCRPCFPDWSLTAEVELDTESFDPQDLARAAEKAGRQIGLLDGRNIGFGRFTVEVSDA